MVLPVLMVCKDYKEYKAFGVVLIYKPFGLTQQFNNPYKVVG